MLKKRILNFERVANIQNDLTCLNFSTFISKFVTFIVDNIMINN